VQHRSLPTPGVHAVAEAKHVAQVPPATLAWFAAVALLHVKPVQQRSKPAPAVHEASLAKHALQVPEPEPWVVSLHAKPVQHSPTAHVAADTLHVPHLLVFVLHDKPVQH